MLVDATVPGTNLAPEDAQRPTLVRHVLLLLLKHDLVLEDAHTRPC